MVICWKSRRGAAAGGHAHLGRRQAAAPSPGAPVAPATPMQAQAVGAVADAADLDLAWAGGAGTRITRMPVVFHAATAIAAALPYAPAVWSL